MERIALLAATLCYLFSFGHTLFVLGAGRFQPGRFNFIAMAFGAAAQGWYLSLRGATEHACPLGSLPEMLIFLSWSIALIYLVIGSTYRLSLMGAFTAPLVLLLQIVALLLPGESHHAATLPHNPWIEIHAALSIVAYGAFGLACVAGLMFLIQEGQLKSRRPAPIFHYLPPITELAGVLKRLLWVGFLLLSLSFAAGMHAHLFVSGEKFICSMLIWVLYALLLAGANKGLLSNRRLALFAVVTFLLALALLPLIEHLSHS
jgi:HemX protein